MCKIQTTAGELGVATLRLRQEDCGAILGYQQQDNNNNKNSSRKTPIYPPQPNPELPPPP